MEKIKGRDFNPKASFTVMKDFHFNGQRYAKGDPFDPRKNCCSIRRLRQLFEVRMIGSEVPDLQPANDPKDTSPVIPQDSGFIYDPEIHEIDNPDRGIWLMMRDGETVCRVSAKEGKRLRGLANPSEVKLEEIQED